MKSAPYFTANHSVALVTGASSGIGEASALALAKAGFRVVLAARRESELDALVEKIQEGGGKALAIPTDLSDEKQTGELVEKIMAAYGRIDVL